MKKELKLQKTFTKHIWTGLIKARVSSKTFFSKTSYILFIR